jgi:hypothetical protein
MLWLESSDHCGYDQQISCIAVDATRLLLHMTKDIRPCGLNCPKFATFTGFHLTKLPLNKSIYIVNPVH